MQDFLCSVSTVCSNDSSSSERNLALNTNLSDISIKHVDVLWKYSNKSVKNQDEKFYCNQDLMFVRINMQIMSLSPWKPLLIKVICTAGFNQIKFADLSSKESLLF